MRKPKVAPPERNSTIDAIRLLAAFLIVFIHLGRDLGLRHGGVTATVTLIIASIANLAVPFFFAVSGYFLYRKDPDEVAAKAKKSFFKLLKIFVCWQIFAFLFASFVTSNLTTQLSTINIKNLFNLVFFNKPMFDSLVLWFILALMVTTGIYYLHSKFIKNDSYPILAGIFGYLIALIFSTYSSFFKLTPVNTNLILLTWFSQGLLFFSIGYLVAKHHARLAALCRPKILIAIFSLYLFELLSLYKITGRFSIINFTLPLLLLAIILLIIKKPSFLKNTKLPIYGSRYAIYIFLIHVPIKRLIYKLAATLDIKIGDNLPWIIALTTTAFIASLTISMIIFHIKKILFPPSRPSTT